LFGTRVLHNKIASLREIRDMIHNQWTSSSGGAVRKKRIQHMLDNPVFFWDQLWGVVLDIFGLSNEVCQE
jgi:hypothetical protein